MTSETLLLAKAESFFSRAMATGYAAGAPAMSIEHWPGWKGYEYREDDFRLVDMYTVHPGTKKSAGHTYIHYQGRAIWVMSYGGFYVKRATPCLKGALLKQYKEGPFNAGRGNHCFVEGHFRYQIEVAKNSTFARFRAQETVVNFYRHGLDTKTASAGGHDIWGMALI